MGPQSNQDVVDARRAAEEKKARAIADVWDAIAERKRNREQESPQTKAAGPKAIHHRQENGTEMTTEGPADVRGKREDSNGRQRAVRPMADGWAAIVERKRKREQDIAQMQKAPPHAKQRRVDDGTERSTDRQAEMSCKQQNNASATETVTLLANEAKAARKGKSFQYVCPACQKS